MSLYIGNNKVSPIIKDSGPALAKADLDANGAVVNVTSVDTANIVTIGDYKLTCWQKENTSLVGSLSFTSLTTVGVEGIREAFYNCTGITGSISFPALTSIGLNGFYFAFCGCTGITGSISFPALTSIGNSAFNFAFFSCTGITEIHFKSSMQSAIEAQASYDSKFGATNATIYFDL